LGSGARRSTFLLIMPELPEVETIRRQLQSRIVGKTIKKVQVLYPKLVRDLSGADFIARLKGKRIGDVLRQGKLILIRLNGKETLVMHLKMTGRLLLTQSASFVKSPSSHLEAIFTFSDGSQMFYADLRRFGYMKILPTQDEAVLVEKESLGIDFFDERLTLPEFTRLIRSRGKSQIKPLLMDQTLISGIGNIYAQEACFAAKIYPLRKAETLRDAEIEDLYNALHEILNKAIQKRGSSSDAYVDAFGQQGEFVPYLKIYGREGKPCPRCKTKLQKKNIGGRGTVFCAKCQK